MAERASAGANGHNLAAHGHVGQGAPSARVLRSADEPGRNQRRRAGEKVGLPTERDGVAECGVGIRRVWSDVGLDHSKHLVALDQALLGARGAAECGGGQAVDVAPSGGLVEKGQCIGGKQLTVAAAAQKAHADVGRGVPVKQRAVGDRGPMVEPGVDA